MPTSIIAIKGSGGLVFLFASEKKRALQFWGHPYSTWSENGEEGLQITTWSLGLRLIFLSDQKNIA